MVLLNALKNQSKRDIFMDLIVKQEDQNRISNKEEQNQISNKED
jgi:hypothetical protein